MTWLDVWGPALFASIAGVVAAAAFTWFFTWRADRDRKQGVRMLVSQEILHNDLALRELIDTLKDILDSADQGQFVRTLMSTRPKTPSWQRSRWDLPDVGTAFKPMELWRLSEWHLDLDSVALEYEGILGRIQQVDLDSHPEQGFEHNAVVKVRIVMLVKQAEYVLDHCPESPAKQFMRAVRADMLARSASRSSARTTPDAAV